MLIQISERAASQFLVATKVYPQACLQGKARGVLLRLQNKDTEQLMEVMGLGIPQFMELLKY